MNPREHLKMVLMVKAGSHLYNLNTETSDTDYRGCVVCTHPQVLFGFHNFEQLDPTDDLDRVLWNLPKFVKMALKGNTQALEVLFAPDDKVVISNEYGYFLREHRHMFLSKQIFNVLKGYGYAEYKRSIGESTGKLGDKRKQEIKQYGYSPKNASHCLRLMMVGIHLFKHGEYKTTWDGYDREFLMDFKLGKHVKPYYDYNFDRMMKVMEENFNKTHLNEHPDEKFIIRNTVDYLRKLL